eukprot:c8627_g1_i1.p1 GENE.c8627_g1_i1~~c8627_g1_i1.p1  ORF type:complete len:227 (-),score=81.79 c8627_g1_i1:25-705(-)
MSEEKVVFGYWKIRGLAQPIRMLLEYTKTPYTEEFYVEGGAPDFDRSAWTSVRETTLGDYEFPNLPYIRHGSLVLTQSHAILRYIGRKANLLGLTDEQKSKVDLILDELKDFKSDLSSISYSPRFPELKPELEKKLPASFAKFSKFLGTNNWVTGDSLTIADFVLYEVLDQHQLIYPTCLDAFPNLKSLWKRFAALPEIETYMKSDRFLSGPCNNTHAYTTQNKIC